MFVLFSGFLHSYRRRISIRQRQKQASRRFEYTSSQPFFNLNAHVWNLGDDTGCTEKAIR
jgi:hypothetical protein